MKLRLNYDLPQKINNTQLSSRKPIKIQTSGSKSFRSKIFQRRGLSSNPKVYDKQITMHQPIMQDYLSRDYKLPDTTQVPELWGCINVPPLKIKQVQNYLGQIKITTSQNIFKHYMYRKSILSYGMPLVTKEQQDSREEFLINKKFSKTLQKINKYQGSHKTKSFIQGKSNQLKPQTSRYTSRFAQRIEESMESTFLTNPQIYKLNNKSIYKMSLQQLQESIKWKKDVLNLLQDSLKQTRSKYY